jgi:thiamine-phosphate pyrophosphorylase
VSPGDTPGPGDLPRPGDIPRLHVVTDAILARADFPRVAAAVTRAGAGRLALHVRGPHTTGRAVYDIVDRLRPVADDVGASLVVNDRVDVALALDVRAVHLGTRSLAPEAVRRLLGPDGLIGCSTHGVDAVAVAASAGVDYVFLGNVFDTASHPEREGLGAEVLADAVVVADAAPVLAIGGIDVRRAAELRQAGAYGVAVLRGVWDAGSPADAVTDYISALGAE